MQKADNFVLSPSTFYTSCKLGFSFQWLLFENWKSSVQKAFSPFDSYEEVLATHQLYNKWQTS